MRIQRVELLTQCLQGAWRAGCAPLEVSPGALAGITPLLAAAGAGGLGWWRVRNSPLSATPAGRELRQAFRSQALQTAFQQQQIALVTGHLRKAGVEPLLAKGWVVARHYGAVGLRPLGDIDLCVPPEMHRDAAAALGQLRGLATPVDLHRGFEHTGFALLDDRSLAEIYARSQLVPLGHAEVRVPGAEDHLRLLCLHMLGHGARRPLWVCDVAAALESRPPYFDWHLCLGGDRRRSEWVVCALLLAHRLLGARIEETPLAEMAESLPGWMIPSVLRAWEAPFRSPIPMGTFRRRPKAALAELRHRWPNGIEGTIGAGGRFNGWPRLPYQVSAFTRRSAHFLRHLANSRSL